MNETQSGPDCKAQQPSWGPSPSGWHELGRSTGIHTEGIQRGRDDPFLGRRGLPSYSPHPLSSPGHPTDELAFP